MSTLPVPDVPDDSMRRVEELVQRTQRSVLEGMEGILQRQTAPLLEQVRRTLLETTDEVLNRHAEPLASRLSAALREVVEELQARQLGPLLERLKQVALAAVDEVGQKHAGPLLTRLKETLRDAVGDLLRRQMDPLFEGARQGMRDSADSVREYADLLVGKVREAVAEPIAQVLRVQVPEYARHAGVRLIDYVLAAVLFSLAAVFLLMGVVQGLQQAGLPTYLTYILGGLAALGTGLVFLRLYTRPRNGPGAPHEPHGAERDDQVGGKRGKE
jgi:hypothetical protein